MSRATLEQRAEQALSNADERDEALAAEFGSPGEPVRALQSVRKPSLADSLAHHLTPLSEEDLALAELPDPHAFEGDGTGLFPVGEVTVIGSPGREGKTSTLVALAIAYALGRTVAGCAPRHGTDVVVYSAEDSRKQFARKLRAQTARMTAGDAATAIARIRVPDLEAPELRDIRQLITLHERSPVPTIMVDSLIAALAKLSDGKRRPGLVFFETASTLTDADEDNRGHRALIAALQRIARELSVAAVLIHHTSQAAANNLPDLTISTADIRGATSLVANARQCFLLVNLGSEDEPFADGDARTVLRRAVAPGMSERLAGLVCLDSSKCQDPPPVFFRWHATAYGPALAEHNAPSDLAGKRWRKLHEVIRGRRAEMRQEAKDEGRRALVSQVVRAVAKLTEDGKQATARAVSVAAGKSPTWGTPYLQDAVRDGLLVSREEKVERRRDPAVVYYLNDSTEF